MTCARDERAAMQRESEARLARVRRGSRLPGSAAARPGRLRHRADVARAVSGETGAVDLHDVAQPPFSAAPRARSTHRPPTRTTRLLARVAFFAQSFGGRRLQTRGCMC